MSAEMKNYVLELLDTCKDRERKIAVLRYELDHPAKVLDTEQIEAMSYGGGDGVGRVKGRISNKTLYIALNYEEQAERMNAETVNNIADELYVLEQKQRQLMYYITLLEKRQADIIRMVYLERTPTGEVAEHYGLTYRTIDRIKKAAIESLAEMYAYSECFKG